MSNKTDVRLSKYLSKRRNLPVRLAKSDRVLVETKDTGRKVWVSKETLDKAKDQYKVVKEKGKELAKKGGELAKKGLERGKVAFQGAKTHLMGKTGPAIKKALNNFGSRAKGLGQMTKASGKILKDTFKGAWEANKHLPRARCFKEAVKASAQRAKDTIIPVLKIALKGITKTPVAKAIAGTIAAVAAILIARKLLKKKALPAKVEGSVSQMLLMAYAEDADITADDMEKHFKESVEEAIQMALDDKLPDSPEDMMKEE